MEAALALVKPSLFELSSREREVFGFDALAVCACFRTLEPGKPQRRDSETGGGPRERPVGRGIERAHKP